VSSTCFKGSGGRDIDHLIDVRVHLHPINQIGTAGDEFALGLSAIWRRASATSVRREY